MCVCVRACVSSGGRREVETMTHRRQRKKAEDTAVEMSEAADMKIEAGGRAELREEMQ